MPFEESVAECPTEQAFEEHARDGRGVKHTAQRDSKFLYCLAARSRALCPSEEAARMGRKPVVTSILPVTPHRVVSGSRGPDSAPVRWVRDQCRRSRIAIRESANQCRSGNEVTAK